MKTACLSLVFCLLLLVSGAADEIRYAKPQLLMEPEELARPAVVPHYVILDARKREAFETEHIPGARWVDHDTWRAEFEDGKDPAAWSRRIGDLGISSDSRVVVYDEGKDTYGARIWWTLRYWGLEHVRLLNGGWHRWQSLELPTNSEAAASMPSAEFRVTARNQRLATLDQVLDSLEENGWQIVDARTEAEHCGIDLLENQRGGAIPHAKNLEWTAVFDPETKQLKEAAEIKRLLNAAGIDLDRPTASHCQSGGRGAVMAFALELMGAEHVRNYYRGWSEWGNLETTPIMVPPASQ